MDEKKNDEGVGLTSEELDDLFAADNCRADEEPVAEYYFTNSDPYARLEPRPDDAPGHNISFDEKGNIVVKNPSAFWLPDVKIVAEIGGTEYTVTGSYEGTETLDKKLRRIMEQNADDDESDVMEGGE